MTKKTGGRQDCIFEGRDNNFNLLRMLGAITVVIAHGYNVTSGRVVGGEPLESLVYVTGFRALDLFFIFSGFLVTASLLTRRDSVRFWVSRGLRIFPALIVVSIAIVLTIGPLNTTEPLVAYFQSPETWTYAIVTGLTTYPDFPLPGVFANLPVPDAVNVPIWTLRYELILYLALFLAFLLGVLRHARVYALCFALLVAAYVWATFFSDIRDQIVFADHFSHFSISFAFGSLVWIARRKLPLSLVAVAGLWGAVFLARDTAFLELLTIVASGYSYFWLAFVPAGFVRRYNKLGDYSYGLYIIHWPIAQTLYAKAPGLNPLLIGCYSLALSLPLAVLSWHLVEKPCLGRVDVLSARVRRALTKRGGRAPHRPQNS